MARQIGDGIDRGEQGLDLLEFLQGLRGELHVTLEEGTLAAWLHEVL
jgi:hypothetical protein